MSWNQRRSGLPVGSKKERDEAAISLMDKHGYDPIEAMVLMAVDPLIDEKVRASMHKELARYKYRPVTPSRDLQNSGDTFNIQINQFGEESKKTPKRRRKKAPVIEAEVQEVG